MAKKSVHRHHQADGMSHHDAQSAMMEYCFGRLSHAQTHALEEHVFDCRLCEAEGFDSIISERMHSMQQRPHTSRKKRRVYLISLLLAASLVLVSGAILSGAVSLPLLSDSTVYQKSQQPQTASPVAATATIAPVVLKNTTTIGVKGITAVSWSPDDTKVVAAIDPDSLGGTADGGVTVYAGNTVFAHLPGFEGFPSPGALAWSADGKKVAASGHLTLMVWTVAPNAVPLKMTLPANPDTNLYVFDAATGNQIGAYPDAIFLSTGFVQWQSDGKLTSSPPDTGVNTNIPAPSASTFALWSAVQGIRIFRAASSNITYLGVNDADRQAHNALLRWSPDGKYLVWGYPQIPVSSNVLMAGSTNEASSDTGTPSSQTGTSATSTPTPISILSPNAAFAMLVARVSQSTTPDQSIVVWASPNGLYLAFADSTTSPAKMGILDANSAAVAGAITIPQIPSAISLNTLSWQSASPLQVTLVANNAPATEYVASH